MVSTKLRLIEVGSLVWLATAIGGDCFPGAVFATISRHFVVGRRYRAFAHLSKCYTLNKSWLALSSTHFCCMGLERSRKRGQRQRLGPTLYNMQILRPEHASKQSSLNVRNTSTRSLLWWKPAAAILPNRDAFGIVITGPRRPAGTFSRRRGPFSTITRLSRIMTGCRF